jgi:hypothetical protein
MKNKQARIKIIGKRRAWERTPARIPFCRSFMLEPGCHNPVVYWARKLWKVGPFFASRKGMAQSVLASKLSYLGVYRQALSTGGLCLLADSIRFGFVLYCTYEF